MNTKNIRDVVYPIENTWVRSIVTFTLTNVYKLLGVTTITGLENVPASGPVVLAPNHVMNYDPVVIQMSFPRLIFYMAKQELYKNPIAEFLMRNMGAFPVDRGNLDRWSILHAKEVIDKGQVLGIFPEGTRSRGKGLQPAKTGAAHLAMKFKCPILPMALNGTQYLFKTPFKRARVTMKVLPLIVPGEHETAQELTDRLMKAIAEALPEDQRGVYGEDV